MLEEFKSCLTEKVAINLNEQKVVSLAAAVIIADEEALNHVVCQFFLDLTGHNWLKSLSRYRYSEQP